MASQHSYNFEEGWESKTCVDYRDLNKSKLKDDFPLPLVDVLVDNTVGQALFSFMDGFSGKMKLRWA